MRKLYCTLVSLLLILATGLAQQTQPPAAKPGGAPKGAPGAGGPGGGAPPSIGRVFGKVTDSTGLPMAEASALVLKSATDPKSKKSHLILIKGTDTKASGEFNFEDLPIYTPLVLRISATGYKSKDIPFRIMSSAPPPAVSGAAP